MPSFGPVSQVASLMEGFARPWYIAGGWAIDLFLERETREHEDVDVAILRRDQTELRSTLATWTFEKVVEGQRLPWAEGERLDPPVHELHADRVAGSPSHLEILLNECTGTTWRFRRNLEVT